MLTPHRSAEGIEVSGSAQTIDEAPYWQGDGETVYATEPEPAGEERTVGEPVLPDGGEEPVGQTTLEDWGGGSR